MNFGQTKITGDTDNRPDNLIMAIDCAISRQAQPGRIAPKAASQQGLGFDLDLIFDLPTGSVH